MKLTFFRTATYLLLLLPAAFTACIKDQQTTTITLFTPVYKSRTEVIAGITNKGPQRIVQAGKIYVYGDYIFLNDIDKGIHIIDNSKPTTPRRVGFVAIPGNVDIAVKNNTLYADLYSDMVAVDIRNPMNVKVTKVVEDLFPDRKYSGGFVMAGDQYIVDWIRKDTIVKEDAVWTSCINCGVVGLRDMSFSAAQTPGTGIAGSMARFSVVNDYLYTVNNLSLVSNDISIPAEPVRKSTVNVGSGIETIYPFRDKLFIGSSTGMFIYDISNPATPSFVSNFAHIRACDPVITDGDFAYVTLSSGTWCTRGVNQLEILSVKNMSAPSLVSTTTLNNPKGLGKQGDLLWICDGTAGLRAYDVSHPLSPSLVKTISGIEPYDVIVNNGKLIVTAKEGLVQYDVTNVNNIRQLSKIATSGL